MKLKAIHLFLIIVLVLILCCGLGNNVIENMDDMGGGNNYAIASNNNAQYSSSSASSSYGLAAASSSGPPQAQVTKTSYAGSGDNSADVYSTSNSKVVVTPSGQQILADPNNTTYGISQNQIPAGQEDLYILKSQIVPPVCPACPSPGTCSGPKCPACPACARCPEPAFECKKVPNYQTSNSRYLPRPVLSDFSQFGM